MRLQRAAIGKIPSVGSEGASKRENRRGRILLLAARQPDLRGLLEDAGFAVEARRRPENRAVPDVDLAIVFRGRLIGRNQAAELHGRGIPVVEVLTSAPTTPSSASWIRLSNRISKPDLVQVVHALADRVGNGSPRP
jgi:hypothetical protein